MNTFIDIIALLLTMALLSILLALPTMFLWNAIIPSIFGLQEIGFWQALALNLLCSTLFKSSHSSNK